MNSLRSLTCLVAIGALLLSQVHLWAERGCSMCGASCRCAPHTASGSCSVRSGGCGGGDAGASVDPAGSPRAVIVDLLDGAPPIAIDRVSTPGAGPPSDPARPPLTPPPRTSC